MFTKSAAVYDAIYSSFKNYEREAARLGELIEQHRHSAGRKLLDVACGTGAHIEFLRRTYAVEGLDLDDNMLAVARGRFPEVTFHHGDMLDFDLRRQFDVVTCLFSAIGYVKTPARMAHAVANLARHLAPGGVLIVEPWLTPEAYEGPPRVRALYVDNPELKIARMNTAEVRDRVSLFNFHYLVGTPQRVEYFTEHHELGLFTTAEYRDAFTTAGLAVTHDPEGLMGRGLFIGVRPAG
jgi:ubiquinone/menaquinone biosynthesis C-methylase UbiE